MSAMHAGAILYLHGGAFCLGNARSHRAITTRLAAAAGLPVWVPEYRLAPEHPHPAGLQDARSCWRAMRDAGYPAERIVVAGDSAGGGLALALTLSLRDDGEDLPAGLALLSPVTDPSLSGSLPGNDSGVADPMIRRGWLRQALDWYRLPANDATGRPLRTPLTGLPPMLIQAGDQEILLSDAVRLAAHARRCGVETRLEIHAQRWHVFHLHAVYLQSARRALRTVAEYARARVTPTIDPADSAVCHRTLAEERAS